MSKTVIQVEGLSKQYRLGQIGTGSLAHDINRWWHSIRGKENPYLKIGEKNDRASKGESDYVWSLRDINFEIKQGDAVGIIGRNGAGKSTLLKILSRVTAPTTGSVKVKGRVASLLEVGTGFHPELSGRENIFLNGAILGMRKNEVKRKFDEIVDFAGVERYIDTPVKRYSSGMYVRLAFGVAAHLESEILIVDEVLAVGDAEFQKKCLGKMQDVSSTDGRTVLFVSHNLGMVNSLCKNGIVLENGTKVFDGSVFDSTEYYISNIAQNTLSLQSEATFEIEENLAAQILKCGIYGLNGRNIVQADVLEKLHLEIEYELREPIKSMNLCWTLTRNEEIIAISFDTDFNAELLDSRKAGKYTVKTPIPSLKAGTYTISLSMGITNVGAFYVKEAALSFEIIENSFDPTYKSFSANRAGLIPVLEKWVELNYQESNA